MQKNDDGVDNNKKNTSSSLNEKEEENGEELYGGEGYTPLDEIGYFNGAVSAGADGEDADNTFFFACAPPSTEDDDDDDDDDENDGLFSVGKEGGGEGVFFANMSAFQSSDASPAAAAQDTEENELDYVKVADGALRALEDEYTSTLQSASSASSNNINTEKKDASHQPLSMEVPMTKCAQSSITNNNEASSIPPTTQNETAIDSNATATTKQSFEQKDLNMDKEAVLKAMSSIQQKAPSSFTAKFDTWTPPPPPPKPKPKHAIIPTAPLTAFSKSTPKAIQATYNLSRSATMTEALHRLLLQHIATLNETLLVHVVGVDQVECHSQSMIQIMFGPFVRWITASPFGTHLQTIKLVLVGPNVPKEATSWPPIDLLPPTTTTNLFLKEASAICINNSYHEYLSTGKETPDFAIAFNAGLWGYTSWIPTLDYLCLSSSNMIPMIVTSYTVEEGEDDGEVLEELVRKEGRGGRVCWECEVNPFGSKKERETKGKVEGRVYRENGAWQCWLLGGGGDENEAKDDDNAR